MSKLPYLRHLMYIELSGAVVACSVCDSMVSNIRNGHLGWLMCHIIKRQQYNRIIKLRDGKNAWRLLFEENEDLLHLFEKFGELHTLEAQATSTELAEHANKVMHTLDEGIKGLKDIDTFYAYIRHIGATHHQVPGFKEEYFWKIEQPFLQAAKTTLGDRYTPNIENIYKLTIKFILENLVIGYKESATDNVNGQLNEEMER
ncbi:unnamed protein product [Diatraea saccharalis]|uniref:Globin domain-containing protein n=1 Tax=Diatraea saccharalis TaxID=40085 RepID=A0A9N9R360_9NEOP|nr:unnamed protein product [Diatraea saccharalis]